MTHPVGLLLKKDCWILSRSGSRAWLWPVSDFTETNAVRISKDKQSAGFSPSGICHLMFQNMSQKMICLKMVSWASVKSFRHTIEARPLNATALLLVLFMSHWPLIQKRNKVPVWPGHARTSSVLVSYWKGGSSHRIATVISTLS